MKIVAVDYFLAFDRHLRCYITCDLYIKNSILSGYWWRLSFINVKRIVCTCFYRSVTMPAMDVTGQMSPANKRLYLQNGMVPKYTGYVPRKYPSTQDMYHIST